MTLSAPSSTPSVRPLTATIFVLVFATAFLAPARAQAQCNLNPTDPSVTICAPANGATVTSPVNVVAGTTSSKTVSAIWVYVDTVVAYKASSVKSINANITIATGTHTITVKAWNTSGTLFKAAVTVNVTSGTSGPVASISPTSLNFATVNVGNTSAPQSVTLANTGTATLNISSIAASGDFSQTNVCGATLSPGGSCTISVTFTPTTTGARTGSLTFSDDAPGSPQSVSLTGTGGTPGSCTASTVNPSVTICTPLDGATVPSPVHIVALTTSTTFPTTAMWIYVDNVVQYKTNAKSLDTYLNLSAGTHSVNVQAWNSSGQVFKQVISITVSGGTTSTVQVSPTSLTFPATDVNSSSSPQNVTVSNTGSTAVTVNSITTSGDYSQTNNCGTSIAVSASCTVAVTFTPTATGTRTGTLTISDSAAGSPQTVSLTGTGGTSSGGPIPINHFIFMLQENRSFDSYFSNLNNYRAAHGYSTEVDVASPTATQPQDGGALVSRFHIATTCIEELSPNWLESHGDVNRWNPSSDTAILMDGFVHTAQGIANYYGFVDKGGKRAMGYYTDADLPYYYFMATQFATSDRWFSPVPTNSTVNRVYGFAATSHGHAHDGSWTISNKTIFQALADSGHTWKIYYTDLDSSGTPASRIWRFQPFASNNKSHIVPMSQYFADIQNGTLPDFAFIESGFLSGRDEHPGGTNPGNVNSGNRVQSGAAYVASIINPLMSSPSWKDTAFILSWDEMGGLYDHVPPDLNVPNPDGIPPTDLTSGDPQGDFTRTGFRVPLIVVSPWTKPHFVSHTSMDYTAVLKLVETRFGISPLTARDAAMPDMTEFFDFVNKPWATPPTPPAQPTNGSCNYTNLP